jgi:hypothetical protein
MTTTTHADHPHGDAPLGPVTWTAPTTLDSGQRAFDLFGPFPCGAYGKVARVIHKPRRPGEREMFTVWNMTKAKATPHFCGTEERARSIAESFLPVS